MEWQPIATAHEVPGKRLLGRDIDGNIDIVTWVPPGGHWDYQLKKVGDGNSGYLKVTGREWKEHNGYWQPVSRCLKCVEWKDLE